MRFLYLVPLPVFCLIIQLAAAPAAKTDSLKNSLKTASELEKIAINYQLAADYEQLHPDSAFSYYNAGIALARKLKNDSLTAKGYNAIGYLNFNRGKYNESIEYLFKALKMFESNNMDKMTINCLQYIGMAYNEQGLHDQAMNYTKLALEISKTAGYKYSTAVSMTNIGAIYYAQQDFSKALDYFQQALHTMEEANDKQGISDAINNVALIYEEQKQYDKALEYHIRSLQLAEELKNKRGMAASYHNIALVYKSMNRFAVAIKYIDSCITTAQELDEKFYLRESYHTLSEIYALSGKYDLAYKNHLLFSAINDTLLNNESKKQFAEMSTKYEAEKKDNAILLLNKEKEIQYELMQRQKIVRNIFIGGFAVVLLFASVFFTQRNKIKKGKKLSDELLLNILPEEVADELKEKGEAEAQLIDHVTVLFTDFKGFTAISEQLTPKELVRDLNVCFSEFDRIMEKHGMEKIKTIGDSYMAAGGLPTPNTTHAADAVNAALEIRQFIDEGKARKIASGEPYFEVRIGIHTGPVVAGIVGVKKFSYDIWGDTVNTASRMESSGEVGKVNISGKTYELVKDKFNCTPRGKIHAKNKGSIDMYFVEGISER